MQHFLLHQEVDALLDGGVDPKTSLYAIVEVAAMK